MANIKKFGQEIWIQDKLSIGDYATEPRVTIDMSGKTDAIFVPVGYSNDRPLTASTNENGYFRYNSELNKFEGFQNLSWQQFVTNVSPDMSLQFASGVTQTGSTELYYDYNNKNLNLGDSISNNGLYNFAIGSGVTLTSDYSYGFGYNLISESSYSFIFGYGIYIDDKSSGSYNFSISEHNKGIEKSEVSSIFGGYDNNILNSDFSIIAGGFENNISGSNYSSIAGGSLNRIESRYGFIGAGVSNIINSKSSNSFIGAGGSNIIDVSSEYSGIVGGHSNRIESYYGFIGAGESNLIDSKSSNSFIGAGGSNIIYFSEYSGIVGGESNRIDLSDYSSIVGGNSNIIDETQYSGIVGGESNRIESYYGFIGAGSENTIIKSDHSSIIDGKLNTISGNTTISNNSIISSYNCKIINTSYSSIISCSNVNSIRSNLVHVPDLYIDNLKGAANLLIGDDGIVISGETGYTSSQINDNFLSASTIDNITDTQIVYGNINSALTSSSKLTWDGTYLQISGSSSESVVISSSGSYYIGDTSTDGSWRLRINSSGDMVIEKRVSGSWTVGETISV